jgi:gas vesicle protein
MRRVISFLLGGVAGGLVGAVLVLLLTPASGSEIRGQVRERVIIMRDDVQAAASARRVELEQQLAQLRAPRPPQIPQ